MSKHSPLFTVPKKTKIHKTTDEALILQNIQFYQLATGDFFSLSKKKYKKINDDFAKTAQGVKRFFWPQDTVKLPKKMSRDQVTERYPITQYES